MSRKPKAHKLPESTQIRIGKRKQRRPDLTYADLAREFNCTYDQARGAVERFDAGRFSGRRGGSPAKAVQLAGVDAETAFHELVDQAALELAADNSLSAVERIMMLDKLARTRLRAQQIKVVGHIKGLDAEFLIRIVKRFMPDASETECITILREVEEEWKASAS